MIGIKTPILRNIALKIFKNNYEDFLNNIGNTYYEEVLLEGLVIANIKDLKTSSKYFDVFIDKIDNWAICDMVISSMKIIKKNKEYYLKKVKIYLKSNNEFIVRVGVIILLDYYLDNAYLEEVFSLINNIKCDKYYVKMAVAWLLSISLIKYKEETLAYLKISKIDTFTYNKALQKARESKRVNKIDKELFESLKKRI